MEENNNVEETLKTFTVRCCGALYNFNYYHPEELLGERIDCVCSKKFILNTQKYRELLAEYQRESGN